MTIPPDNKAIYNQNWDDWFDQKVHGPASRWLRWLVAENLERTEKRAITSVVDVGCGQGATTEMIARMLPDASVFGIDFSDAGIAAARCHYVKSNLTFSVDESSTYLESGPYDLITCFEVLEHVPEWEILLHRICSASKKYVMLSFPTGNMRKFEAAVGHVRNFQRGEVERFMLLEGFRESNIFYAGFPFYSPLYRNFCNLMDAGNSAFASGQYGFRQKAVSAFLFTLFRYFSMRRAGDQFCGLFERQ